MGIFLAVSCGTLLMLIALVTGGKLFVKRDLYTVRYTDVSVSGLDVGAQVKYHGVRVGRVDKVFVDPNQVETVIITLSLDHGTPVKSDVQAVIAGMALTGVKIIELTGGSSASATLKPGAEIPAGASTFDLVSGRVEAVSEKLELVLTNLATLTGGENQSRLLNLIDNTAASLQEIRQMLADNSGRISNTMTNLEIASENLKELSASPEIRRTIANLDSTTAEIRAAQIGTAVSELRDALTQARTAFTHIDLTLLKGRHDILSSLEVMRESLDSFNEFTRLIAEDPSLLLRGKRAEEVTGK